VGARFANSRSKIDPIAVSMESLAFHKQNPSECLPHFITVDETWIRHFTPYSKPPSKQWIEPEEPIQKKAKTILSMKNAMATIFWDVKEIILLITWRRVRPLEINALKSYFKIPMNEVKYELPH
jgi:hypothetical protein